MKNVLVTGSNGQLGNSIRAQADDHAGFNFVFTDVAELDITNKKAVMAFAEAVEIDYIVNCAAYTAVDKAEENEALAQKVNADAVQVLGEVAQVIGAKVVHVSTDYVFDGTNSKPYVESDSPCPVSAYGRTKLAGELALFAACPESVVFRTAWLYSEYGSNFVKTMLRLGEEKERLSVIFDQVGTPTYAGDLASAILAVLEASEHSMFSPGIYHFSNEGVCSWYDFALKIMQLAQLDCSVLPIETKEYPTPATRPHFSVLNKHKIKTTYGITIPHWEKSLIDVVARLKQLK